MVQPVAALNKLRWLFAATVYSGCELVLLPTMATAKPEFGAVLTQGIEERLAQPRR